MWSVKADLNPSCWDCVQLCVPFCLFFTVAKVHRTPQTLLLSLKCLIHIHSSNLLFEPTADNEHNTTKKNMNSHFSHYFFKSNSNILHPECDCCNKKGSFVEILQDCFPKYIFEWTNEQTPNRQARLRNGQSWFIFFLARKATFLNFKLYTVQSAQAKCAGESTTFCDKGLKDSVQNNFDHLLPGIIFEFTFLVQSSEEYFVLFFSSASKPHYLKIKSVNVLVF